MTWEENQYLIHYGIKGQKKGHRRFQNEDGSLTPEGKERYGVGDGERRQKSQVDDSEKQKRQKRELTPEERAQRKAKVKKILKIAGAVTLAAAAGYMAYKIGDQWTKNLKDEYQNQAYQRANNARRMEMDALENKIRNKQKARIHNIYIRNGGKNYEGRAWDVHQRRSGLESALAYAKAERDYGRQAQNYTNLAKNVTREELVKNFIRNKGSIVIPNL